MIFSRWCRYAAMIAATCGAWPATAAELPPRPLALPVPVAPACISSPFGPRRLVGPHAATIHNGIDFPAPAGAWVHAVAAGEVTQIRRMGSEGLEVDIAHPDGSATRYAHLGTVSPALATGRRSIAKGEAIGRIGRTGVTYGTHLHFEMRLGGVLVDPEPSFQAARCGG